MAAKAAGREGKGMKYGGFAQMSPAAYLFYSIVHPSDGFQEMKYNRKGSMRIALMMLGAWVLIELFSRIFTDYDLNDYAGTDESLFRVAVITVLVFAIAVFSNWCFCTLLDGKGRLRDIAIVGAYSLTPYLAYKAVFIVLSYVVTASAAPIFTYISWVFLFWSALLIFIGLRTIHDYSTLKTLFSVVLTIFGILIILFIGLLTVNLYQQIYVFISTLIMEMRYQ